LEASLRPKGAFKALSLNVALLGLVSLLTDVSSEMITPALPFFIASLGGGGLAAGLVGGLGDGASSLLRLLSGYASDRMGRRKPLVAAGYLASAFSKLAMASAGAWIHVAGLRMADRAGKGVRTPPRDALIAESVAAERSGRAFGLHRAMDTSGAVLGSLAALMLLGFAKLGFRELFIAAGLLAFIALLPLRFVKEEPKPPRSRGLHAALAELPKGLKLLLPFTAIFAAGNLSLMLLLLKASLGFEGELATLMPLALYLLFNCVYAASSYPCGAAADRLGRMKVLAVGYAAASLSLALLAHASTAWQLASAFTLYGLSYACVDTVERAVVAEASREARGIGLGAYHCLAGLAAIGGNALAGALWDLASPIAAFTYAALLTAAASLGLAYLAWSSSLKRCQHVVVEPPKPPVRGEASKPLHD
jgi:MFS family permease